MSIDEKEVLIALLKEKAHFNNVREENWYHIPVETAPKRWPPEYLGFYQPKAFGVDAFRIRYFGRVKEITQTPYKKLFPNKFDSQKSDKMYYQVFIERLEQLPRPIPSRIDRHVSPVSHFNWLIFFTPRSYENQVKLKSVRSLSDKAHQTKSCFEQRGLFDHIIIM